MNTLKTLALTAAIIVGSISASQASFFDSYNASLNTPQAKQEFLVDTCDYGTNGGPDGVGDAIAINNCEYMKANGVYDSDARIGAVALGVVVGGAAGMAAASVPVAALGGKTLVGQWGLTSVFGLAPTVAVMGTTGAVLGGVLTGVAVYPGSNEPLPETAE